MAANTHSLDLELSSSQYAWIADNADVSVTGDITIECWIKLEQKASDAGTQMHIINKWDTADNNRSYTLWLDNTDDKLAFTVSDDGTLNDTHTLTFKTTTTFTTLATWVHISCAFDISAETCNFCVNGVEEVGAKAGTSIGATIDDNSSNFHIGCSEANSTPATFFDGKVDGVRLHNTLRTEAWIAANKDNHITPDGNCVGYWKLNNDYVDAAKGSNLAGAGTPVFSTDVPFVGTARQYVSPGRWMNR